MDAYFWNFNKKENSTKTPTTTGTKLTIKLKERVEVDNPVLLCQTNVMSYNYMQFEGSYYFIRRKTYVNNSLFEIEAQRDALATLKSEIKTSSQFVTRSNVVFNNNIIDNMYPKLINPTTLTSAPAGYTPPFIFTTNMMLVLTVKSPSGSIFYGLRLGNYDGLAGELFARSQKSLWEDLGQLPALVYQNYLDPFGYITDARLIPIDEDVALGSGSSSTILLGHWSFTDPDGVAIFKTLDRVVYKSTILSITIRSGFSDHKAYLNTNEFRSLRVYLPGVGFVYIDPNKAQGATSVIVSYEIDVTGAISYKVVCGDDVIYTTGNISTPYAVYSNLMNSGAVIGAIGNVIGGAVAGATGGALAAGIGAVPGAVMGAVSGGLSSLRSAAPLYISNQRGSDGSLAALKVQTHIFVEDSFYDIPTQAPDIYGYPAMVQTTLGTDGYYQIDNPVVDFGDDLEIRNAVIGYMRSGFYVE